jgi:hypothetical protein
VSRESPIERVIAHLRAQVAELRRMEQAQAGAEEIEERRRAILELQEVLSRVVLDRLGARGRPLAE